MNFDKLLSQYYLMISRVLLCFFSVLFLSFSSPVQSAIATIGAEQNGITTGGTITYVGAGTASSANGCGNITPTIPGGANGDILIALVNAREESASATVTMAGWTTYGSASRANFQVLIFYRIADGTEGATATISQSGTCNSILGRISRFSGVDSNSPFETDPITGTNVVQQNSGNLDTGTETTTSANAMTIVAGFIADDRTIDNGDATGDGYTESFDSTQTGGRDSSISLHYRLETTAGNKSISNWDMSGGGNDQNYGIIFALKPSGLTIDVPAGTTADHVMVAAIAVRPSTTVIGAPAGWTLIRRTNQAAGNSNAQAIYYRVATASEPTSYTWTFSGGAIGGAAGGIISYSGVDTGSPIDIDGGNTTASSSSHTANSVTTTVTNTMLISAHSYSSAFNWTEPGGMTEQVDIFSTTPTPSGGGISISMSDETIAAIGATGSRTATSGDNDTGVAQMIALTPFILTVAEVEYHLDESSWGTVTDSSGNGNDGSLVGTGVVPAPHVATTPDAALTGDPGTCGYGDFPNNTNNTISAINTTFTPGNVGSISFWFNNKNNWNASGDRLLFDASQNLGNNNADKQFFLVRRNNNNGSLRFVLEDSNDLDMEADVTNLNFTAGTWVHIAVTWDLPNDEMQIYVNGVLRDTDTTNTNGTIGNIQSLYIGDQRGTGYSGSGWSNDSANGYIDEFKVYNTVISDGQISYDSTVRHSCASVTVDHYAISYPDGTPGVTCEALTVRVTAHEDATDHTLTVAPTNTTTITLSTTPAADGWTLKTGGGTFTPPNQYTFDGTETFAEFWLTETTATTVPHIDIDVTDGTATDLDGVLEDDNIEFADAVFRFFAGGVGEAIGTQIAGKESDIAPGNQTIQLRSVITNTSTMACESRILNTTTIEMAYKCNNPTTCQAARRVQIENAAAATFDITPGNANAATVDATNGNFDNVDLDFGAAGTATFSFDFTDVGQIQLFARETLAAVAPDPAITVFGTSNMFVVRPFGIVVGVIQDSGGGANPAAVDATGNVFVKAGEDFRTTIAAVNWGSGDDDGTNCDLVSDPACLMNDGIPDTNADLTDNNGGGVLAVTPNFQGTGAIDITLSAVAPFSPSGGILGNLEDSGTLTSPVVTAGSFSGGFANITTIYYDEVGTITLKADGSNYLSTGQDVEGRSSNIATNPNNGSVGRFIPDRFNVSMQNTPTLADSCSGFTYQDQAFHYDTAPILQIEALNNYGDTTLNYGGTFWKLTGSLLNRDYVDGSAVAPNASFFPSSTVTGGVTLAGDTDFDGIGTLALATGVAGDSLMYQKGLPEVAFDADVDVTFLAVGFQDTDHTGPNPVCFDATNDGICDDYTHLMIQGTELRWGRLILENGFGSELLPIEVPLKTQYFTANGFVINDSDDCTTYDSADMSFSNGVGVTLANLSISGNGTVIDGVDDPADSLLATSTANEIGSADVTIDLTAQDWLQYDWDNDDNNNDGPFDDNPTSRISWGIFSGPDEFIYIREPW